MVRTQGGESGEDRVMCFYVSEGNLVLKKFCVAPGCTMSHEFQKHFQFR